MRVLSALLLVSCSLCAHAAETVVAMNLIDANGNVKSIGNVTLSETRYGLVFTPNLEGLPPGVHGFHVHENASCKPDVKDGQPVAGLAAGGHYDPLSAKRHGDAWGDGHLGDLPGLVVDQNGHASYAVLSPRLKLQDVQDRALMIHIGGDNHADHPQPLGGGGGRLACGVIGR